MSDINFGDYAIADAYEYHFDKAPEVYWKINPVTSGHELQRGRFLMRSEYQRSALEIAHREIALLFGGTNLKTKTGELVLADNASIEEVEAVLAKCPPDMIGELWVAIGELYPKWGPIDPKAWRPEKKATASENSSTE